MLTLFLFTERNYITLLELTWFISQILPIIYCNLNFGIRNTVKIDDPGNSYYFHLSWNYQAWNTTVVLKGDQQIGVKTSSTLSERGCQASKFQFLMYYHAGYWKGNVVSIHPPTQLFFRTFGITLFRSFLLRLRVCVQSVTISWWFSQ